MMMPKMDVVDRMDVADVVDEVDAISIIEIRLKNSEQRGRFVHQSHEHLTKCIISS